MNFVCEEALAISLQDIRRLSALPFDVEVVKILPPLHTPGWVGSVQPPPLYLHIRHPCCMPVYAGQVMPVVALDEFLARHRVFTSKPQ